MSETVNVVIDRSPVEVRAAAIDESGRPYRLFIDRWGGEGRLARLDKILKGRLRHSSAKDGGAFFELSSGEQVFVRGEPDLTEGAEANLLIMAEARRGKLARAKLTEDEPPVGWLGEPGPLDLWLSSVTFGRECEVQCNFGLADEVFDLALMPRVGLPGGGAIEITRTSALVAIDVDTAGREGFGSAGARAHAINREAVVEAARQLSLRGLGGLCVIDCVGPVNRVSGGKLRDIFIEAFKAVSDREVEALAPSRFGLLEVKLAWGEAPLEDWFFDEAGRMTPETELLGLFRDVTREAKANSSAFYRLALSPAARGVYTARRKQCDELLQSQFSGRVSISAEPAGQSRVERL